MSEPINDDDVFSTTAASLDTVTFRGTPIPVASLAELKEDILARSCLWAVANGYQSINAAEPLVTSVLLELAGELNGR